MAIQVYNSRTRQKEPFETIEPGKVRMYVCGPTVYDSCHIGHARSVVVFDVIVRYLRSQGYDVNYIRNFTDIDDKIIQRAAELNTGWQEVAEKYIAEFYRDMDALKVQRASREPRATEHIGDIVRIVNRLLDRRMAYQVEGGVYFAVEAFPEYGGLSGRKLEDMLAGARVDVNDRKRNPFDFVLWKASKPGEPAWDSPWGPGRPGWHIECSAMSSSLLGETIDIHGGGQDLIFPHHENEVAQSEAAFGQTFVKYWIHNGFVNIEQEKMSKSLGNFLMIRDVLQQCHPEAVRLFLLSSHYRSPIDYNARAMDEAEASLEKLYTTLLRWSECVSPPAGATPVGVGKTWAHFCEAMDDDFNTARALGILFDTARQINRGLDDAGSAGAAALPSQLSEMRGDVQKMAQILGILGDHPADFFEALKSRRLAQGTLDAAAIEALVQARVEARKARDWKRADELRQELEKQNIVLEDRPDGSTRWKVATGEN